MSATMLPNRGIIKSFTLIELIVTLAVILMMILASVPMLNSGKEKDLFATVDRISALMEKAKNYALNPQDKDASKYSVTYDSARKVFTVNAVKDTGSTALEGSDDSLIISDKYSATMSPEPVFVVGSGNLESSESTVCLSVGSDTSCKANVFVHTDGSVSSEVNNED